MVLHKVFESKQWIFQMAGRHVCICFEKKKKKKKKNIEEMLHVQMHNALLQWQALPSTTMEFPADTSGFKKEGMHS